MRTRSSADAPLFTFLDVPAQEVSAHGDALRRIYDKQLDGLIIRNVFSADEVRAALRALDGAHVPKRGFPGFADTPDRPYTVGDAIVGSEPSLERYFGGARAQRERLRAMFGSGCDFEQRIQSIFTALGGGLAVDVAPGPEGNICVPATVRVLPRGSEIGVHVGNEFIRLPQAEHLREVVDMTDQVSFFVPLSVPNRGGELVVYGLEWSDVRPFIPTPSSPDQGNVWFEGSDVFEAVAAMDSTSFTPGPGDMLIFDGGRYFHRVAKVEGDLPRRTVGGFLGFSKQRDRILYWS